MPDLNSLVTLILGAGAVAVAVVAGLSFGSRKALRESNQDLRDRISDLEKKATNQTAEIAELQSSNKLLNSMVTGEIHWKALAEAQDQFIRDAHKHWGDEHESLTNVVSALSKVLGVMDRVIKKLDES